VRASRVVEYRYTIRSIEKTLDAVKIWCPRGHWFNAPAEALTLAQSPNSAAVRAVAG